MSVICDVAFDAATVWHHLSFGHGVVTRDGLSSGTCAWHETCVCCFEHN